MSHPTLLVTDVFCSLQGEGPKLGTPSIFLRLAMCNLHCSWCDTKYTWKEGELDYREKPLEEVIQSIQHLREGKIITNLVITGGEPLLQQKNLVRLLADERLADMSIEFETNGSQRLLPTMELFKNRLNFNISPKLEDSGNKPYKVNFYANSVLKFVYVSQESEEFIDRFLDENKKEIGDMPIFIMPEGISAQAFAGKTQDAMNYCMKKGFRFTPRLHIYLFGNQRGT